MSALGRYLSPRLKSGLLTPVAWHVTEVTRARVGQSPVQVGKPSTLENHGAVGEDPLGVRSRRGRDSWESEAGPLRGREDVPRGFPQTLATWGLI